MIGIIGAMEEEIEILKNDISDLQTEKIAHVEIHKGNLYGKNVILMRSGIGKVNAAICATLLIQQYQPDMIINTGSAGGLGSQLSVGDVVVSKEVVHHDVIATAFGYDLGQVPGMPLAYAADSKLIEIASQAITKNDIKAHIGLIVSGDSFVGTVEQKQFILNNFTNSLAVEMEAAAIAQTCHQFEVPFIITRAISDLANGEASMSFDEFLKVACVSSSKIVKSILETLPA